MREIILAGMFAFSASTCLAQTTPASQPASPPAVRLILSYLFRDTAVAILAYLR